VCTNTHAQRDTHTHTNTPVDDCGGDGSQEALRSDSEVLSHGRRGEDHVQVVLDFTDERVPAVFGGVDKAQGLCLGAHAVDDLVLVLLCGCKGVCMWV
jgi:hypothetical protein